MAPFAAGAAEVSIPIDLEITSADQSPKAALFFMQYDENGTRIANDSVSFGMIRGQNNVEADFVTAPGAKGWNIAIKLSGFDGRFSIGKSRVSFTT